MKQYLVISFLFLSAITNAQDTFLPDEIWFDSGKNLYVQFCLPSVNTLDQYSDASKIFADIYSVNMQARIREAEKMGRISIGINGLKNENRIRIVDPFDHIISFPPELKQDSSINFQELRLITNEGAKINCYFRNSNELILFLKNDWEKSIQSITAELKKIPSGDKRKAIILHYRQYGGRVENTLLESNPKVNNLDMLVLKGGVSVGLFKGKFLSGIDAEAGLMFSQKGIMKNYYFVHGEEMFDFVSENNKLVPKSGLFIDLGYKRNFSGNPEKANWYGFSVGYLVRNHAAILDDNTWRLSLHRDISKNIELVPQLYFPDNFSKIFPGLKIIVSF